MPLLHPFLGALVLLLPLAGIAQAQTDTPPPILPLPDPTEPTRPVPLDPPIPDPDPPEVPLQVPDQPQPDPPIVPPELEETRFPIERIEVIGNTVLADDIAALVQPLEGQDLTLTTARPAYSDHGSLYQ